MKHLLQPNRWSCLPTSFAMILDMPLKEMFSLLGHDGSNVVWPELPEPQRRRAFHPGELVGLCWDAGRNVTIIEPRMALLGCPQSEKFLIDNVKRFERALIKTRGVLIGEYSNGRRHAVAWSDFLVYDPDGTKYMVNSERAFAIESYYIVP